MAQDPNYDKYIDVDNTVIKPSPQRVRNILTLDEKIAVIKAYDQRPMYKKIARMFNCSWEQIKNIIINRVAIMEFYEAAKAKTKYEAETEDDGLDVRQKKIRFLGECVYECLKRLQYHAKVPITEELIRTKTLEFLDILRIPNFVPTKKWLNLWKATYNITLSNRQISIYSEPQFSLDIKDIMAFCARSKTNKCVLTRFMKSDNENVEYETKRLRKLNFLQEALKEYLLRVKFHHKSMKLSINSLQQVANDFNEILKVGGFKPTEEWIAAFKRQNDSEEYLASGKKPPLSLDLKDILSYCSRMQNKAKDNTVTLAPKETALQMRILPKYHTNSNDTGLKFQQNAIIYLDEENSTKDIKPNVQELRVDKTKIEQTAPPPLKIRKIESINNDPQLHLKISNNSDLHKPVLLTIRPPANEQIKQPAKTVVFMKKVNVNAAEENSSSVPSLPANVQVKEENLEDDNYILPTRPPQMKIKHVQHLNSSSNISPIPNHTATKNLTHSPVENDNEELPRHVTSFKDVLRLLKPLEEYAMLKENYRAIGLITQLEEVLKNTPDTNNADDEFID